MKRRFRKIISAVSAVAMIGTLGLVPVTVEAAEAKTIYERGNTTAWSESDLSEWTLTGNAAVTPTINADHGLYSDCNQTGAVTKEFTVSDSAVVTYDVDFYTASSTGRDNNYAYVKFGSEVAIGYNKSYYMYYSTDGGETYNATAVTGNVNNKTTNIKATINTSSNTLISLTINGAVVASAANKPLSNASYNSISMGFVRAASVAWNTQFSLKSVNVSEVTDSTVYRHVTFDVDGMESYASVANNSFVTDSNIPKTDKTAYIFKGWAVNGDTANPISNEAIKAYKITADTRFTAVYAKDSAYIEPMTKVEFGTFPTGGRLVAGPDENTSADNSISVKMTGELGTDLVANPDSRVKGAVSLIVIVEGIADENAALKIDVE